MQLNFARVWNWAKKIYLSKSISSKVKLIHDQRRVCEDLDTLLLNASVLFLFFVYFVCMSMEARGSHWVPFFFFKSILTLLFEAESLSEPGVYICDSSLTSGFSDPPVSTSLLLLCRCMSPCMAFWCQRWGSALWSSCFVASTLSAEPPECILFGNDS